MEVLHLDGTILAKGEYESIRELLEKNKCVDIDSIITDLRGANLSGVNLEGANLGGVDLSGSDLENTNLRGADLRGVDLEYATLRASDLRDTNLTGVNLRGACLRNANLKGVDLRGAACFKSSAKKFAIIPFKVWAWSLIFLKSFFSIASFKPAKLLTYESSKISINWDIISTSPP